MADSQLSAYYCYAVAQLQFKSRSGNEVDTRSVYACDVSPQVGANLHLADGLAVDARLCDQYASSNQFVAKLVPVYINLFAQECDDRFLYGRRSHDENDVSLVEHGLSVYDFMLLFAICAMNLRNHEVASQEFTYLLYGDTEYHLVGNFHREGIQCHRL